MATTRSVGTDTPLPPRSNAYFRSTPLDYPLVSLSGYLHASAIGFLVVTAYLAFFQAEDPVAADDPDMDLKKVYSVMWDIVKLKREQPLLRCHWPDV